jgi:hypothetical protein
MWSPTGNCQNATGQASCGDPWTLSIRTGNYPALTVCSFTVDLGRILDADKNTFPNSLFSW